MSAHPAADVSQTRDSFLSGGHARGMRALAALTRGIWQLEMQERSFFLLLAFGWMMPVVVYLFVWRRAAEAGAAGDLSADTLSAYYLILAVVNQFTYATSNWTVGDLIRDGGMNSLLLRPIHPFVDALANELASKGVFMLLVIPATGALWLVLKPAVSVAAWQIAVAVPALLLAWALRFFWGYWLALLSFWTTRADALLALQDALVFLLAGQVAPVALLPSFIKRLATVLPFRYMLGFPVEIVTGQLGPRETMFGLLVQLGWTAASVGLYSVIWHAGVRRYEAIGG